MNDRHQRRFLVAQNLRERGDYERALAILGRLLLVALASVSCTTSGLAERDLHGVLALGGPAQIQEHTTDYLEGGEQFFSIRDLRDSRVAFASFSVHTETGVFHYSTRTTSDYVLCLLEIRHQTSSARVIAEVSNSVQCPPATCGACYSATYELPEAVRDQLVKYWTRKLDL